MSASTDNREDAYGGIRAKDKRPCGRQRRTAAIIANRLLVDQSGAVYVSEETETC
jgi:hypothetical protein